VDQISQIGGNDDGLNIWHRSIFHTVDAEKIIGSLTSYPTGEDPSDVEWRTCIGNRVKAIAKDGPFLGAWSGEFSEPSPDLRQAYNSQKAMHQIMLSNNSRVPDPGTSAYREFLVLEASSLQYAQQRIDTRSGRLLCRTQVGYVGLVPRFTIPGDLICIVYGCPVPLVVRNSDTRKGAYRLVGECYVHGIMKGESLENGRFVEKEINIH
jgi:hypothetical protein